MTTSPDSGKNIVPAIDFAQLVLGFSSAALHYMGQLELEGHKDDKNLPLAKQNIDIIEILQEKTKGNLTPEESRMMTAILQDLRLKYVEASR